jgi:hypothetical protein
VRPPWWRHWRFRPRWSRWRWRRGAWSAKVSRFVTVSILAIGRHSLVGSRHVGIEASFLGCFVGVAALHTRRVDVATRGLERGPGGLALFCAICSGRMRCLAIVETGSDFLIGWELWFCSRRRHWPSWGISLGLCLCISLCISRLLLLLLLLLPVLSVVHILPCLERILTLGRRISAFGRGCWTWEVCETIRSSCLWSLICTRLCPSGWWRVCRSCLIWIASSAATATAATTCGIQSSFTSISIVSSLLTGLT